MITVAIARNSKQFFFDRAAVQKQMDATRRKSLVAGGALIRTVAKNSIRKAKRMKLGELAPEAQVQFEVRKAAAEKAGRPKPKLPWASSLPGEPPRSRVGLLKQKLFSKYDPESKSVVIGPEAISGGTNAPATLEYGGRNESGRYILPRPYMRPAEAKVRSQYLRVWKDAFNKS